MTNVVLSKQPSASYVATIDQNSPFGRPALKLVITSTVDSDYVNIRFSALDIPLFDDHVAARIFVDDAMAIQSIRFKIGNSGFAHTSEYQETIGDNGIKVAGKRTMYAGPLRTVGLNTFVFGVDSLQDVMLTAYLYANRTTTLWIDEVFIPDRQRPILCMTWDDNYSNWLTEVLPLLVKYGHKATFGFNSSNLNADGSSTGAAFINAVGLQTLYAAGNQVCSHCVNNYKLQTVSPNSAFGPDNGTIQANSLSTLLYAADYLSAANKETKFSMPASQQNYHPWVQGGVETAAVELLGSYGVNIARTTNPYEINLYGFDMSGVNIMTLRSIPFGSSYNLAALTQKLADTVKYGGLMVAMGHDTQATASDAITLDRVTLDAFMALASQYVLAGELDVMRMIDLESRLRSIGLLTSQNTIGAKRPVRCIGRLKSVNFNSTADQLIPLDNGSVQGYRVTGVIAGHSNGSTTAITTAVGGIYQQAAKAGVAIVPAAQTYTGITASATSVQNCVVAETDVAAGAAGVYFSLTTAQGATAICDVFVFGYPI